MKKILILLLLSVVLVFANVGKITAVKGTVFVERDTKKLTAKSGFILKTNDKVVTQGKSKALVLFNDNTSITVGKDSSLSVNEFVMDVKNPSNSKTNFGFGKGVFRTITGKIGKINPKGFKIKTKSASIGIRGTTLDTSVKQLPNGNEQVDVAFLKGQGILTNNATGVTVNINTGQRGSFVQGGQAKVEQGKLEDSAALDEDSNELGQEETRSGGQESEGDEQNSDDSQESESENSDAGQGQGGKDDGGTPTEENLDEGPDGPNDPIGGPPTNDLGPNIFGGGGPNVPEGEKNRAPNAQSKTENVEEDTVKKINVLAFDSDGDLLKYSISGNPNNGTATIDPNTGDIVYTPNSDYTGSDKILVTISDGTNSISITVSINVIGVNDSPSLNILNRSLSTDQDTSIGTTISFSDVEDGNNLSVKANASNGTVVIKDGKLTYTPNKGYSGSDTIIVTITDSSGATATQSIKVTVDSTSTDIVGISPSGEVSTILSNVTKQTMCSENDCDHYSSYMDYGYLTTSDRLTKTGAYYTGSQTPSEIIQRYIDAANTAAYSGGVAAFVDGVSSAGSINLYIDFGNKKLNYGSNVSNIQIDNGGWKANINNGTVHTYGFSSSDISAASKSNVSGISGSLDGKFYGPSADAVGGSFKLTNGSKNVNGTFGAKK